MFDQETRNAVARMASENGIEPEVLLAVAEVESGGKVFASVKGRKEPLIRFEGHYFYRLLPKAKRNLAVTRGLAHVRAGRIKNPLSQSGRWKLLRKCEAIDRDAALQSVSWGLGQVMGVHWRWLGYSSTDHLVAEARSGADGQIAVMLRYIVKAGLKPRLENYDWRGFARGYNGPGYAKHKYHIRLKTAHARHLKNSRQAAFPGNKALKTLDFQLTVGDRGHAVMEMQADLRRLGFPLEADGDFGPVTARMVKAFQKANGLEADGIVGPKTFEAMARSKPPIASSA